MKKLKEKEEQNEVYFRPNFGYLLSLGVNFRHFFPFYAHFFPSRNSASDGTTNFPVGLTVSAPTDRHSDRKTKSFI